MAFATYDETKLGISDKTVELGTEMITKCSMHSKIWFAHLLHWVGLRFQNQKLNQFFASIESNKKCEIGNYYAHCKGIDPFLHIQEIKNFIHSNSKTDRFIHINTYSRFPPLNLSNQLIEITLQNYQTICTDYSLFTRGLKVGQRYMFYNNEFKPYLKYNFYNKAVSNSNICNKCRLFKDKQKQKRSDIAYKMYITAAAEKRKYNAMNEMISTKSTSSQRVPCCRQCAVSNGCSMNHDMHCQKRNVSVGSGLIASNDRISFKVLHSVDDKWKDDSMTNICDICKDAFSVFKRKHHCRICGDIICDKKCSFFTSRNGVNVVKQIGTFEIVEIRGCVYCKNNLLQYCHGANGKEKQKWIYKRK